MSETVDHDQEAPPSTDDDPDEFARVYDNWQERYGDEDPYEGDDDAKPHPDEIPASAYEHDEDGGYNPAAGAQDQNAARAAGRCSAQLHRSEERYGEPRYCTRLPEAVFVRGGSDRCYVHKSEGDSTSE
jgi:hypothetical protein